MLVLFPLGQTKEGRLDERIAAAKERLEKAKQRIERMEQEAARRSKVHVCRGCNKEIPVSGQGRPRVWCQPCRDGEPFKRWFKSTYGGERAREYQREYKKNYRKRKQELDDANNGEHNGQAAAGDC